MSALARYFKYTGRNVAGYDKMQTGLTDLLQNEGIDVHFEDDIRKIPKNWNPNETLAVFTPALPDDHNELSWFREKPIGLLKRAKVLGLICNEKNGIAIAGTHGKTSVSTMVANILIKSKSGCGAFLGGISKNFESNLVLPKNDSQWIVAEADEFDRSFLHLNPLLALITSIDADHLDIYGDKQKIIESFEKFIEKIKPGGKLVIKKGVELNTKVSKAQILSYSLSENTDFSVLNLKLDKKEGIYHFDIKTPDGIIANCKSHYPGLINVENAVAAAALALLAGASANEIKQGIADYSGVVRRFDIQIKSRDLVFIDDYAHHPVELKAFISSVKELFEGRNITGIFQPHLYSRTRDFAKEFAESLDLLDEAILIPLYPARENPIPGVSSEIIFDKMKLRKKHLLSKKQTLDYLSKNHNDIVVTMGAGDIDKLVPDITELLKSKNHVC